MSEVYSINAEANAITHTVKLTWTPPADYSLPSYIPFLPETYNIYYKFGTPSKQAQGNSSFMTNWWDPNSFKLLKANVDKNTTSFETQPFPPGLYTFGIACVSPSSTTGKLVEGDIIFKSVMITATPDTKSSQMFNPAGLTVLDNGYMYYLSPSGDTTYIKCITPYGEHSTLVDLQLDSSTGNWANGLNTLETDGQYLYLYINESLNTSIANKVIRISQDGYVTPFSISSYIPVQNVVRVMNNKIYMHLNVEGGTTIMSSELYSNGIPVSSLNFVETIQHENISYTFGIDRNGKAFAITLFSPDTEEVIAVENYIASTVNVSDGKMYGIVKPATSVVSYNFVQYNILGFWYEPKLTFPEGKTSFSQLQGVTVDASGMVYVSEYDTNSIWRIDKTGTVTLYAGYSSDIVIPDLTMPYPPLSDFQGYIGDVYIQPPASYTPDPGDVVLKDPEGNPIGHIPLPKGLPPGAVLTYRRIGNRFYIIYNGRVIVTYLLTDEQMTFFLSSNFAGFYTTTGHQYTDWQQIGHGYFTGNPPVIGTLYTIRTTFTEPMDSDQTLWSMSLYYYGMDLLIFEDNSVIFTRDPLTEDLARAKKVIQGGRNYDNNEPLLTEEEAWAVYNAGFGEYLVAVN